MTVNELTCPNCGQAVFYAELSESSDDSNLLTLRCADVNEYCTRPNGFIEIAPEAYMGDFARLEVRE